MQIDVELRKKKWNEQLFIVLSKIRRFEINIDKNRRAKSEWVKNEWAKKNRRVRSKSIFRISV